jgi:FG-GAP repeat
MLRTLFRNFYYVAVLLLFPVWTNAQVLIPKVTRIGNANPASNAAFGTSVAGISDVNGDGIGDLIVGTPGLTFQHSDLQTSRRLAPVPNRTALSHPHVYSLCAILASLRPEDRSVPPSWRSS